MHAPHIVGAFLDYWQIPPPLGQTFWQALSQATGTAPVALRQTWLYYNGSAWGEWRRLGRRQDHAT